MTVIDQRQTDLGTLLDDLAELFEANDSYEDVDEEVTNSGETDDWTDNARVFFHEPTGLFLLFYISVGDFENTDNDRISGIRLLFSEGWDADEHQPTGRSAAYSDDRMDYEMRYRDSFTSYNNDNDYVPGIFPTEERSGGPTDLREYPVTYFGSVTDDGFRIGAWNTTDGDDGAACTLNFEHVGEKFWNDGNQPFAIWNKTSFDRDGDFVEVYSWNYYESDDRIDPGHVGDDNFGRSDWGIVNPDSEDDTYFFRRPVIYRTVDGTVPVAFMKNVLPNDLEEGAAHGDTIIHDGTEYRAFAQSGAYESMTIGELLKYE